MCLGLFQLGLQLLVLLVQAFERSFLNQDRLSHVVGRCRLLLQVLGNARLSLGITGDGRVFGLPESAEQAIDQGLFFTVHGQPHTRAGGIQVH
ncbi:hypothetical protein D3C78_978130 [compost metagenome]